jgi:hypothetical protein
MPAEFQKKELRMYLTHMNWKRCLRAGRWPVLVLVLGLAQISTAQVIMRVQGDAPITADQRAAAVEEVSTALLKTYVFPDTAEEMAGLIGRKLKDGAYDGMDNGPRFCSTLTEDLRSISKDKHLRVMYTGLPGEGGAEDPDPDKEDRQRQERIEQQRRSNFDFQKLEILEGNVGYLRLNSFTGTELSGATAVAAMNFLANCDAVIFDLRGNGGGNPSLIQLITSYFIEEPTHLNSFYIRESDTTRQFWTAEHVEGPRMAGVDVYVLTSSYTFSGAEEFSYNMQSLKRGTLVGETTGGGAHPVNFVSFPEIGISMSLPFGRAVNPVTGTNWEGTGVVPDIAVPAEKALDTAHMEALKKLSEKADSPQRKDELARAGRIIKARIDPVVFDEAAMAEYAGSYGDRKIFVEDGKLLYRRGEMPQRELIALGDDQFIFEGVADFVLQIERNEAGQITAATGIYGNDQRDVSPRDE